MQTKAEGELCLPGDRHQHRERKLWQSGSRITCILSGTCVYFLRTRWPHNIHQHSSSQPYSHRSLLPRKGSIRLRTAEPPCLGLRATWKVENYMEHCVNSKSQCQKQKLGREEWRRVADLNPKFLLLKCVYYCISS